MTKKTSANILNTSANLLGFCLFVITSFHIGNFAESSMIDESTSVIALLLIGSSLFSFFSIRAVSEQAEEKLETIAEYLFAGSLIGIFIIIVLMVFNYIR